MRIETINNKRIRKMCDNQLHHFLQLLEIRLTNHEKQVANYPANRQIFSDQMTNHIKGQMDTINKELQTRKNNGS